MSAKEDINISTAFSTLVREMLIKEINEQQELEATGGYDAERARAESFNLTQKKRKQSTKKGCCK